MESVFREMKEASKIQDDKIKSHQNHIIEIMKPYKQELNKINEKFDLCKKSVL